jgi:hypothetical protein
VSTLNKAPAADQRRDGHSRASGGGPDIAVGERQLGGGTIQARGAECEQRLPRRRCRLPHVGAATRQTRAAAGAALVRADAGVAVDDRDAPRRHAELFGRHLRDRDPVRTDVHFAGVIVTAPSAWNEELSTGGIERLARGGCLRARPAGSAASNASSR